MPAGWATTALLHGAAQIVRRQPFQDLMRDARRGGDRQLQRRLIGDAGAIEIGRRLARLLRELGDLKTRPVNEDHADAQAAQQNQIEQQIAEVVMLDNGAVESDDEDLIAILRHIAQNFAQVHEPLQGGSRRGFGAGLVGAHSHGSISIAERPGEREKGGREREKGRRGEGEKGRRGEGKRWP